MTPTKDNWPVGISWEQHVENCQAQKENRQPIDLDSPYNPDGTFKDSGKYKSLRAIKTMRRRWRNR